MRTALVTAAILMGLVLVLIAVALRPIPPVPAAPTPRPTTHVFERAEYLAALDKRLRYGQADLKSANRSVREGNDTLRYSDRAVIRHLADTLRNLSEQVQKIEEDLAVLRAEAIQ